MLRRHIVKVIICVGLISTIGYSNGALNLANLGTYAFLPQQPVVIKNPLFWGISATCSISIASQNPQKIMGKMLKKSGTINGQNVGDKLILEIKNGDSMRISADGLAQVEITNQGDETITANCGLGMLQKS
ncbi:hypothetical protein [Facilibium subflavum]|uniref:hypothetical protein n=1 Tax=Facilibium subflavum TaxID=2219058 RepID=UPI000E6561C4|nr:hypothetical protein [Facilibium subflavum]